VEEVAGAEPFLVAVVEHQDQLVGPAAEHSFEEPGVGAELDQEVRLDRAGELGVPGDVVVGAGSRVVGAVEEIRVSVPVAGVQAPLVDDGGAGAHGGEGLGGCVRILVLDLDQAGRAFPEGGQVALLMLRAFSGGQLLFRVFVGAELAHPCRDFCGDGRRLGLEALAPGGEVTREVGDQVLGGVAASAVGEELHGILSSMLVGG
jgi:hypothetical protein